MRLLVLSLFIFSCEMRFLSVTLFFFSVFQKVLHPQNFLRLATLARKGVKIKNKSIEPRSSALYFYFLSLPLSFLFDGRFSFYFLFFFFFLYDLDGGMWHVWGIFDFSFKKLALVGANFLKRKVFWFFDAYGIKKFFFKDLFRRFLSCSKTALLSRDYPGWCIFYHPPTFLLFISS